MAQRPGFRPKKRFGQHFLRNQGVIDLIVEAIARVAKAKLVEIGPGKGALTLPLTRMVSQIDVIEVDNDLVKWLGEQPGLRGKIRIHHTDVLQFDFGSIASPDDKITIVGNLPYNISTPLLFHLLDYSDCIDAMVVMLQREVAERIQAAPGTKDYGRLSVMMQLRCRVAHLFDIEPAAFYPAPQVHSSMLALHPLPPRAVTNHHLLQDVVKKAFAQRRKTIRNALKGVAGDGDLRGAGIDPASRGETIRPEQFIALTKLLAAPRQ